MNRIVLTLALAAWPAWALADEPAGAPAPLIVAPAAEQAQPSAPASGSAPAFDFKAYEEARARTRAKVDEAQAEYERSKAALLSAAGVAEGQTPQGKPWPQAELDSYLTAALLLIGAGLEYQSVSNQTLPFVVTPGSMQGWLKQWPGNPLNGWQPIRVLPASGTSWPGDINWTLPVPLKYTMSGGRLQPGPYSLSIYGAPRTGARDGVQVASISSPQSSAENEALNEGAQQALAADDVWMRQKALAWTAAQPADADPKQQQLMLRSLPELLRTARRVDKLASEMKNRPRQQWRPEQQTEYLQHALWLVYTGMNAASWAGLDTTAWLSGKPDQKLLPYWPGNPYSGWSPMQLKPGAFGLKNGDIYIEQSPAYFAMLSANGSLVNSYQMYVLGPGSSDTKLSPPDKSNVWAGPPPAGAVGTLGISTTPLLSSEFNRAICHS